MPLVLTSTKSGVSWNSTVPKMFMMLFLFCFNFNKDILYFQVNQLTPQLTPASKPELAGASKAELVGV